jgi:hypothetical protein
MLIIGCDFHTRYQQIAMDGWPDAAPYGFQGAVFPNFIITVDRVIFCEEHPLRACAP